jgi:hypothetical protein
MVLEKVVQINYFVSTKLCNRVNNYQSNLEESESITLMKMAGLIELFRIAYRVICAILKSKHLSQHLDSCVDSL